VSGPGAEGRLKVAVKHLVTMVPALLLQHDGLNCLERRHAPRRDGSISVIRRSDLE
jgi:hypothetical protein